MSTAATAYAAATLESFCMHCHRMIGATVSLEDGRPVQTFPWYHLDTGNETCAPYRA